MKIFWMVAFILAMVAVSPVLANEADNPRCLLQMHPYIDLEEHPASEQLELRGPIIIPKPSLAEKVTKSAAGSAAVHMIIWALNHMYVPINSRN